MTFNYARTQLTQWAAHLAARGAPPDQYAVAAAAITFDNIFMVGDNPRADIRGANAAGAPWKSLLVRTGVFRDERLANDPTDPAYRVVADVGEAVDHALEVAAAQRLA